MKVLVTGRQGQVARSLMARNPGLELVFAGREILDLAEESSIERAIASIRPELIVSAAAYTAVDRAEEESALAMAVNGRAPGVIGAAARRIGARVIHLSTDYVFDGTLDRPWRESDTVAPLNVYGATKLEGERALAASGASHAIVRTAWIFSPFGNNFVKTMLRLAQTRDEIPVVSDQLGCPTSALDIADALFAMIDTWREAGGQGQGELYHFASSGETAWDAFAREIFAISRMLGGPVADVRPIATADYPTAARRPLNSRLDSSYFAATFGYRGAHWRESLAEVIEQVVGDFKC